MKRRLAVSALVLCSFMVNALRSTAAPVYIKNFSSFPIYAYNTAAYKQGSAFVGCGPTTGAMIMGYYHHVHAHSSANGLLSSPGSGVDEGLNTAWALHGSQYMQTQSNGFGSVYRIEPGLEGYAAGRGYQVKVMIHASPSYSNPGSADAAWLNQYGPFGDSWQNDGIFWRTDVNGKWSINKTDFCNFVDAKLAAGIAIFLTIDTNQDQSGDHWVPLIGYDRATGKFAFYDTYDQSVHWAEIYYCADPGGAHLNSISMLRTVTYESQTTPVVNPPRDLLALNGYSGVVPLAWNPPAATTRLISISPDALLAQPVEMDYASLRLQSNPVSSMLEKESGLLSHLSSQFVVDGYNVYRSTSSSTGFTRIASGVTRQYYRDSDIVNGQTYFYKITSFSGTAESDFSNVASAAAVNNGYTIQAAWATSPPALDGAINSGEWSGAPKISILYPGYTGAVTLYCLNDQTKLYLAVDDARDTKLDNLDQVALFFDDNLDREWPGTELNDEGNFWFAWNGTSNTAFALFGPRRGYWPDGLIWDARITPAGLTAAISSSSGHLQYEGSIDLTTSPLLAAPGATVGILVFTFDQSKAYFDSFWPGEAERLKAITPDIQLWGQAPFSFGDLKLAPMPDKKPDISITPLTWDYGTVLAKSYKDKTFVVKNEGTANLKITSITMEGDLSQFIVTSSGGDPVLAPGATRNVTIRFQPSSTGRKSASARVHSNDPDESPLRVTLTGTGSLTGVHQMADQPAAFHLAQNYPNPFNQTTTIGFMLPFPGDVRLLVYDAAGREIRMLCDQYKPAGLHAIRWDGRDQDGNLAASGIYIYQIVASGEEDFSEIRKLVLVR